MKRCKTALTVRLATVKRRIINTSKGKLRMSDIGSHVTTSFILSTASRVTLSILPLGDISTMVMTVNSGFNTSIQVISLLGGLGIGQVCTQTMSRMRGKMLRTFSVSHVLAPRRSTTHLLTRRLRLSNKTRFFRVSNGACIFGLRVPRGLIKCRVGRLGLRRRFNLGLVSLMRNGRIGGFLNVSIFRGRITGAFPRSCTLRGNSKLIYCKSCSDFVRF